MIFVACPYSHPDAKVREHRVDVAARVAGELMRQGHIVFCPIVHGHPIVQRCKDLPTDWHYWEVTCREFMRLATSMTVLKLDSWEESEGVSNEIHAAEDKGIPITYLGLEQIRHFIEDSKRN